MGISRLRTMLRIGVGVLAMLVFALSSDLPALPEGHVDITEDITTTVNVGGPAGCQNHNLAAYGNRRRGYTHQVAQVAEVRRKELWAANKCHTYARLDRDLWNGWRTWFKSPAQSDCRYTKAVDANDWASPSQTDQISDCGHWRWFWGRSGENRPNEHACERYEHDLK